MAGETRRQRRDARRAAGAAETPARLGGFSRQPVEGGDVAVAGPVARELAPSRAGLVGGSVGFVRESWGELKKVDWPKRPQVVQGTIVVLVACLIIGLYLYGADQALRPFVRDVLLRNK